MGRSIRGTELPIKDQRLLKGHNLAYIRSTLDNNDYFFDRRGCGNTTRQVNYAIDKLFNGYQVLVQDHYRYGSDLYANGRLLELIKTRLYNEHRAVKYKVKRLRYSFLIELEDKFKR